MPIAQPLDKFVFTCPDDFIDKHRIQALYARFIAQCGEKLVCSCPAMSLNQMLPPPSFELCNKRAYSRRVCHRPDVERNHQD